MEFSTARKKVKKERYTVYSSNDMTFIMEETYKNGELVSTEVIGFHYGEPYEGSVKDFSGKRKAKFLM